MNNRLSIQQELEIINLKKIKTPIKKIMENYNIKNVKTIYDILKRNGRIHIIGNKKYYVNDNYFEKIDSEEKAYWLGFLYADGYVRMSSGRSGHLKLKLKNTDRNHIEKFREALKSNYPIIDGKENFKVGERKYTSFTSSINIYNTKIVHDLFKLGCLNNKTFKIRLPELENELMIHFIRGYFDGDGCVYKQKNKNNSYKITIVGNNNFIIDIKEHLIKIGKFENNDFSIIQKKTYTLLSINKYLSSLKFYHYIYQMSSVYLDRKKEKYDGILNRADNGRTGKTNIKKYKILDPKGNVFFTEKGLKDFCKTHNLTYSCMSGVSRKINNHHKNWKCEIIDCC